MFLWWRRNRSASLRRLSHYDYWQDRLRPSIIADAPVDMIIYGMGEKAIVELARRLDSEKRYMKSRIYGERQSCFVRQRTA